MRKRSFDVVLALASILFSLVVCEVIARRLVRLGILNPPLRLMDRRNVRPPTIPVLRHIPDSELGWVLPPVDIKRRFQITGRNGSLDVIYTIVHGHRVTSKDALGSAGNKMVPVLVAAGCSFTFGWGVDDDHTWPWLLKENLPGYEVVNIGTNGYGKLTKPFWLRGVSSPNIRNQSVRCWLDTGVSRLNAAAGLKGPFMPMPNPFRGRCSCRRRMGASNIVVS